MISSSGSFHAIPIRSPVLGSNRKTQLGVSIFLAPASTAAPPPPRDSALSELPEYAANKPAVTSRKVLRFTACECCAWPIIFLDGVFMQLPSPYLFTELPFRRRSGDLSYNQRS